MDEPLFECRYIPNETLSSEAVWNKKKGFQIVFLILYVWLTLNNLGGLVLTAQYYGYVDPAYCFVGLFCLSGVLYMAFSHRLAARRNLRRIRKYFEGRIPEYHLYFTESGIISRVESDEFQLPYSKVNRITFTRHLVILEARKVASLAFPRDSFTKGSCEEFLAFLRTKCPDLKIPE